MGKEILYCNACGKKLLGDDFTRGRAHTFENRQFCTECLPATHTPRSMPSPASTSRLPKRQASSMHLPVQGDAPPGPSSSTLYVGLAVGAGVLVLLLILFLSPSKASAPPPPEPTPPRRAEAKKPVDDPARKAVERAREFSSANPHAMDERVRLWEEAVAATARTPYADEALKGLERTIAQRKDEFALELGALEPKLAERLKLEQFGAAADVLEEAKKRHESSPEWASAVSRRLREIQEAAEKLYPEIRTRALGAQASGDNARVLELKTRLTGWGRRDLLADLETELSKVLPGKALPAGATVLFRFPPEGENRPYRLCGTLRDGSLVMPVWRDWAVLGGFENLREPVPIPAEGEIGATVTTNSPKPIAIRIRVIRGDTTWPYDWSLENPEVGRPIRVKVSMAQFKDTNGKFVNVGERISTIYFQQNDPKVDLVIHEAVIFRTKP